MKSRICKLPLEALIWTGGLLALACIDPAAEGPVVSLCLFKALEIDFCLGCGLGRSVAYLFHGAWMLSLQAHPLGPLAAAVLIARVLGLVGRAFRPAPVPPVGI